MTTIKDIKEELRAMIELAENATPGPWSYFWGWNVVYPKGRCGIVADFCQLKEDNRTSESIRDDMSFVSSSRSMTPFACKALLNMIEYIEADAETFGDSCPRGEAARSHINSLIELWEEQK